MKTKKKKAKKKPKFKPKKKKEGSRNAKKQKIEKTEKKEVEERPVGEILKEEGIIREERRDVVPEEIPTRNDELTKVLMDIEKVRAVVSTLREMEKDKEEMINELSENIGEIRSLFFQRDASIKETISKVEKLEDIVKEIKPQKFLKKLAADTVAEYPKASVEITVKESYRNMKYALDKEPKVTEYAVEAIERAGLKPLRNSIRGGTDGARLSFEGLLTPNIFTGGHNFHSKLEWVSLQDMEKAVKVIIQLVLVWTEK